MDSFSIRASSLPLAMKCPNSVLNPEGLQEIDRYNEAAENGTTVHKAIEQYVNGHDTTHALDSIEDARERERADRMFGNATELVDRLPAASLELEKEVSFNLFLPKHDVTVGVVGHVDLTLLLNDGKSIGIVDWKTGRLNANHYHQIAAYAHGSAVAYTRRHGKPPVRVYASVEHLDEDTRDRYTFDMPDLDSWQERVATTLDNGGYAVNDHCPYCPIKAECPAFAGYAQWSNLPVVRDEEDKAKLAKPFSEMEAEERRDVWLRLREIEAAVDSFKKQVKDEVKKADGQSLDLGDAQLVIRKVASKGMDTQKALPVLREVFSQDEIDEMMSLNLNEVLDKAADMTPSGRKSKAKQRLLDKLSEAGAIFGSETSRMVRAAKKDA